MGHALARECEGVEEALVPSLPADQAKVLGENAAR